MYEVRGTRYEVRGTRCGVRGAGYEVRGAGYEVRGTRCEDSLSADMTRMEKGGGRWRVEKMFQAVEQISGAA